MDKDLCRRLLYFAAQSNAIENAYVGLDDLRSQIIRKTHDCHVGALLLADNLAKSSILLEERHLHEMHRRIIVEQNEKCLADEYIPKKWRGAYRTVNVRVGDYVAPHHRKVPALMKAHFQQIHALQRRKPSHALFEKDVNSIVGEIANIHHGFQVIHPFVDGNGRTGRAISWLLFRFFELNSIFFTADDRFETYYPACKQKRLMREYFLSRYQM